MSAAQPVEPVGTVAHDAPRAADSPRLTAAEVARQVRKERARRLARNLSIWVVLPTLLAAVYYGLIARQQYESVTTVVVRAPDPDAALIATMFREHALSRDMLAQLERDVALSKHYQERGDRFTRLSADAGSETRYASFRAHVDATYDAVTHVLTLHVRAFSGKMAQRFAESILVRSERFVGSSSATGQAPLVVVQKPSAPSESTYPLRVRGVVTVFFASLCLFAIGSLLIASVREHAQF